MATRTLMALALGALLLLLVPAASVQACCDWTPVDRAFWDKMYEHPQKFTYDMAPGLTHFKLLAGDEEEIVTPESAQNDELWHHVLHHLHQSAGAGHAHHGSPGHTAPKPSQ